jgi:hypothetical protein
MPRPGLMSSTSRLQSCAAPVEDSEAAVASEVPDEAVVASEVPDQDVEPSEVCIVVFELSAGVMEVVGIMEVSASVAPVSPPELVAPVVPVALG